MYVKVNFFLSLEDFPEDASMDGGFFRDGTDYQILSRKPNPPKQNVPTPPPAFDIPDMDSSDTEIACEAPESGLIKNTPSGESLNSSSTSQSNVATSNGSLPGQHEALRSDTGSADSITPDQDPIQLNETSAKRGEGEQLVVNDTKEQRMQLEHTVEVVLSDEGGSLPCLAPKHPEEQGVQNDCTAAALTPDKTDVLLAERTSDLKSGEDKGVQFDLGEDAITANDGAVLSATITPDKADILQVNEQDKQVEQRTSEAKSGEDKGVQFDLGEDALTPNDGAVLSATITPDKADTLHVSDQDKQVEQRTSEVKSEEDKGLQFDLEGGAITPNDGAVLSATIMTDKADTLHVSDQDKQVEQRTSEVKSEEDKGLQFDLEGGAITPNDGAALSTKASNVNQLSGNHKNVEGKGIMIDLTVEAPTTNDNNVLCSGVSSKKRQPGELAGKHKIAAGKRILIDLTLEDDSCKTRENRTAEGCKKGNNDCGESLSLDTANLIADFIGSVKMGVIEEKESVDVVMKDSSSGAEEIKLASEELQNVPAQVESPGQEDTSMTTPSEEKQEETGCRIQDSDFPYQSKFNAGGAQRNEDHELDTVTAVDVPPECEQRPLDSASLIPHEWEGATKVAFLHGFFVLARCLYVQLYL